MCKVPDPPPSPTPVEPPKAAGETVQRAGNRARDRLRSLSGRRGTVLTALSGAGETNIGRKTLLGA